MKVKFGAIITDGRNKVGGHVLSKNRGGAYMRTKVTPSNPQTSFQNAARNRITTFSQNWRALTQAQRNAWESAVSNFTKTDIFGDIKNPSGINLYVKLNSNLVEIGAAPITLPPLPTSVIGPATITFTAAAGAATASLAWTGGAVPVDTAWIIRMTPQVSPGKSFVKNLYRDTVFFAAADVTPTSVVTEFVARFGTLVAGQKIFVEVTACGTLTGIKSTPISTSAIVAA